MPLIESLEPQTIHRLPREISEIYFAKVPHREMFAHYGVFGEGTCFFHSLSVILNYKDYLHVPLETQIELGQEMRLSFETDLTLENWNAFLDQHSSLKEKYGDEELAFPKVRDNFGNPYTWTNEPMIQYVSHTLGINLIFIDTSSSNLGLYCGVRESFSKPLGIILWIDRQHFEPVVFLRGLDKEDSSQIWIQTLFHPQRDRFIVEAVSLQYRNQCKLDKN